MDIPRPEYPRPQFLREDWLCLNGEWEFEIDPGDSGRERGLIERHLQDRILVPFCPESRLSGIHHTDFLTAVWYRRTVQVPAAWAGQRVLLHFQAVDYDTTVWVNGVEVGRHRGGFTPFTCDIADVAAPGETATIVVRARDDYRRPQPRGKQSPHYHNVRCFYTRTTGIWQTVWLEPAPISHLTRPRLTPNVAGGSIRVDQAIVAGRPGQRVEVTLSDADGVVCVESCPVGVDLATSVTLYIPEARRQLWGPGHPHLYSVEIKLLEADGAVTDCASSYAGLRSVSIDGQAIRINGEVVFQRLVLDQGYYPDGIMTAPSDDALVADIQLSLDAGFNGARLHQKVFEERFLYHADRMGYLVWGEFADWGCSGHGPKDGEHQTPPATYITQWLEALARDYSHPCIIGWCPLNETYQNILDGITQLDDVTWGMVLATKAIDSTRPVLDASGYSHRIPCADVYDAHDYTQDPEQFIRRHAGIAQGEPYQNGTDRGEQWSVPYCGQPFFVSEFGGIWWNPTARPGEDSWGYGDRPRDIEEFYQRFEALCSWLLDNPHMFGYCYTQLTDVYQEQNGIYTFDRNVKFDLDRIRAVQQRRAAIEKTAA